MIKTIRIAGPHNVRLVLDDSDADTPAMVYGTLDGREYSSTYHCALDHGIEEVIEFTPKQLAGLETHEDAVNAAYSKARAGHPDYQ